MFISVVSYKLAFNLHKLRYTAYEYTFLSDRAVGGIFSFNPFFSKETCLLKCTAIQEENNMQVCFWLLITGKNVTSKRIQPISGEVQVEVVKKNL